MSKTTATYRYADDSGYSEDFEASNEDAAREKALEILESGDWGECTKTFRVGARLGEVDPAEVDAYGDPSVLWLTDVKHDIDPVAPKTEGGDAIEWDEGESWGSQHGQVKVIYRSTNVDGWLMVVDYGGTDMATGECMETVRYSREDDDQ